MCSRDNHQQKKKLAIDGGARSSRTQSDFGTKVGHWISKHCQDQVGSPYGVSGQSIKFFVGRVGVSCVQETTASRKKKLDNGAWSSRTKSDFVTQVLPLISKHCNTKSVAHQRVSGRSIKFFVGRVDCSRIGGHVFKRQPPAGKKTWYRCGRQVKSD